MAARRRKTTGGRPPKACKERRGDQRKPRPVSAPKPSASGPGLRGADLQPRQAWVARHKSYAEFFGETLPKGKVLLADGGCVTPAAASREALSFAQYPPRPGRIGWLYVTHGLSQAAMKSNRPARLELALHWRERDTKAPLQVLAQAAKCALDSGGPLGPGAVLSSQEMPGLRVANLQHWLACAPDPAIPAQLELSLPPKTGVRHIRFLLLLGISDAELQCALKVNPALADGRQVLLEALQSGGVFPMSDPERTCLTRRTDFHRLWENTFRAVRERALGV